MLVPLIETRPLCLAAGNVGVGGSVNHFALPVPRRFSGPYVGCGFRVAGLCVGRAKRQTATDASRERRESLSPRQSIDRHFRHGHRANHLSPVVSITVITSAMQRATVSDVANSCEQEGINIQAA